MDATSTLQERPPRPASAFDWILHPGLDAFTTHAQTIRTGADVDARTVGDDFSVLAAPLLQRLEERTASTPHQAWMIAAHLGDTDRALQELQALRGTFAGSDRAEFHATEQMIRLMQHDGEHGVLAMSDEGDGVQDITALVAAPWMANLRATEVAYATRSRRSGLGAPTTQPTDLMSISVGLADARHLLDAGTFGQARVRGDDTFRRARRAALPRHAARARSVVTIADAVTGDASAAWDGIRWLQRHAAKPHSTDFRFCADHARLLLAARDGQWDSILDIGEELLPLLAAAPRSVTVARIALDLVEACAKVGHATNLLSDLLDAWDPNASALHGVAYLAMLAALGGSPAGWLARSAVRQAEQNALPFDAARLQMAFASTISDRADLEAHVATLDAARRVFARAGARDWARDAEQQLSDLETTAPNPLLHVPLTEQEARVASLAASGLTNKQIAAELFLSPRTVSGHLYRVFPKLGVTTRAGLRDALTAARLY